MLRLPRSLSLALVESVALSADRSTAGGTYPEHAALAVRMAEAPAVSCPWVEVVNVTVRLSGGALFVVTPATAESHITAVVPAVVVYSCLKAVTASAVVSTLN